MQFCAYLLEERQKSIKFAKEKTVVDIGFPVIRSRESEINVRIAHQKLLKENPDFELKARRLQCMYIWVSYSWLNSFLTFLLFVSISVDVDADEVRKEWIEQEGQFQIKSIASHYGIYEHLFGYAYFVPRVHLDIRVIQLKCDPWIAMFLRHI